MDVESEGPAADRQLHQSERTAPGAGAEGSAALGKRGMRARSEQPEENERIPLTWRQLELRDAGRSKGGGSKRMPPSPPKGRAPRKATKLSNMKIVYQDAACAEKQVLPGSKAEREQESSKVQARGRSAGAVRSQTQGNAHAAPGKQACRGRSATEREQQSSKVQARGRSASPVRSQTQGNAHAAPGKQARRGRSAGAASVAARDGCAQNASPSEGDLAAIPQVPTTTEAACPALPASKVGACGDDAAGELAHGPHPGGVSLALLEHAVTYGATCLAAETYVQVLPCSIMLCPTLHQVLNLADLTCHAGVNMCATCEVREQDMCGGLCQACNRLRSILRKVPGMTSIAREDVRHLIGVMGHPNVIHQRLKDGNKAARDRAFADVQTALGLELVPIHDGKPTSGMQSCISVMA
jgi:hypothetical protein